MVDSTGAPPTQDDSDDVDPGDSIEAIQSLSQAPTSGFFDGIRRRVQRRNFAADATDFSLSGFAYVALEFVQFFFQLFQPTERKEGDR